MNSTNDPVYYRDRGLDFLRKGKEIFNNNKDTESREKGYEVFKKGLDYMITYAKRKNMSIHLVILDSICLSN